MSNPMLLVAAFWALLAVANIREDRSSPGFEWARWFWVLILLFWVAGVPLQTWGQSIAWIEVRPEGVLVRRRFRSDAILMGDILDIEAHRHWHNPLSKREPAYYLNIRQGSGGTRVLPYLAPEAGDRLLYALYGHHKPILVYNWK